MARQMLKMKEGVVFSSAHFLPHMTAIPLAALEHAPITTDGYVWITQAQRKIRETPLDLHEHMAAIDFRCKNIVAADQAEIEVLGHAWASRMQVALGLDYDVLAHGAGPSFHVHAEFDPR